MMKYSAIIALAGAVTVGGMMATPAFASEGVTVPAGDALDLTPPVDWTQMQVDSAPAPTQRKVRRLREGRSVGFAPSRSHRPAAQQDDDDAN